MFLFRSRRLRFRADLRLRANPGPPRFLRCSYPCLHLHLPLGRCRPPCCCCYRRARRRWTVGVVPCVCVVMVAQASSRCQSDQTHYILVYTFLSELHQGDAWGLRNRKRGGFRMSCQGNCLY